MIPAQASPKTDNGLNPSFPPSQLKKPFTPPFTPCQMSLKKPDNPDQAPVSIPSGENARADATPLRPASESPATLSHSPEKNPVIPAQASPKTDNGLKLSVSPSQLKKPLTLPFMPSQMSLKKPDKPDQAPINNPTGLNPSKAFMRSHAWVNVVVTLSHSPEKKPAMLSQFFTIRAAAATRAVIPTITKPMGFAVNAALKAHWAAVITAILAATALLATDRATRPAVAARLRTRLTANRALLFSVATLNNAMALLPNTKASENRENVTRATILAALNPTNPTTAKAINLDNTGKFSVNAANDVAALPSTLPMANTAGASKPPTATVILLICCITLGNTLPGPFKMALAISSVTAVPPFTDSLMPSMFCLS